MCSQPSASWAARLNLSQRHTLAKKLIRASDSFSTAAQASGKGRRSLSMLSASALEMNDLHGDVTGYVTRKQARSHPEKGE